MKGLESLEKTETTVLLQIISFIFFSFYYMQIRFSLVLQMQGSRAPAIIRAMLETE